jgi:pyruvate formate lyase activating enzyme
MKEGLNHVYTGNVRHEAGDTTYCPDCHTPLIVRDWYQIRRYRLTPEGNCPDCGAAVAGRFGARAEDFGRNRIPIAIGGAGLF